LRSRRRRIRYRLRLRLGRSSGRTMKLAVSIDGDENGPLGAAGSFDGTESFSGPGSELLRAVRRDGDRNKMGRLAGCRAKQKCPVDIRLARVVSVRRAGPIGAHGELGPCSPEAGQAGKVNLHPRCHAIADSSLCGAARAEQNDRQPSEDVSSAPLSNTVRTRHPIMMPRPTLVSDARRVGDRQA